MRATLRKGKGQSHCSQSSNIIITTTIGFLLLAVIR
jgi:hypothetical protein